MCPMPRTPVPACGQHQPPGLRIDALRAAHSLFSEIRPQIGTAPILIWMPEISFSAPLRLRHPQSGPAPKWGRIRDRRNSQARPGASEVSGDATKDGSGPEI